MWRFFYVYISKEKEMTFSWAVASAFSNPDLAEAATLDAVSFAPCIFFPLSPKTPKTDLDDTLRSIHQKL